MIERIVEIAEDARHIFLYRGFLVIKETNDERVELGRIPLDEIAAVIANAHGLSYTNNILVELAKVGIPFVLCGANHNAVAILWPIEGHHLQAKRMDAQVDATKPQRKRLWAQIVAEKVRQQAQVLEAIGEEASDIKSLVAKIKSGDNENIEAQAARKYWPRIMGKEFRRDTAANEENALLNYGYTVLRAATARSVIASGLHPNIPLHHKSEKNSMRLVDDLMEPFRPIVDLRVWQIKQMGQKELDASTKAALVRCLYEDLYGAKGLSPVIAHIQALTNSLALNYLKEVSQLEFPLPELPMELLMYEFTK